MKRWLQLTMDELLGQRPAGCDQDMHFPESFAAAVIDEFTQPGDIVLDPFAGYGTTLAVAERLARRAVGVELLPEHAEVIRGRITGKSRIITGDARNLAALVCGPVDLCLTSPPYMPAENHPENPLNGYETLDGDYLKYLAELDDVFCQVAGLLRPGGHAVVNVANLEDDGVITPLAWDVARIISHHLVLRQEAFLCWDRQPEGISGDYCFVFQRGA